MDVDLNLAKRLILVVDDEPDIRDMVESALSYEGYRVDTAGSGDEALEKFKSSNPDLILMDVTMPGLNGLEALVEMRKRENYVAVMFVSALSGSDDIVRGLDAGADDYISKPFDPAVLLARIRAQLRIKDLHDRLSAANKRLLELIDIDDLTGLFNMRSIYQRLENEIARARRQGRAVGVVMMDMDKFKSVNDSHDHLFGSFVLSEVGKLIRNTMRQIDFAARYGGDEFLIVLSDTTPEGVQLFAERLRKAIAAHTFKLRVDSMSLTASLGVACFHNGLEPVDAKGLVRQADNALYEAKRSGRNCVRVFQAASALKIPS